MTDQEVEKLNQSSSRNSHFAWLVDSGATCHVLSYDALGCYEVVKEHSGPLPVLMSASDTEMECLGSGRYSCEVWEARACSSSAGPCMSDRFQRDHFLASLGFGLVFLVHRRAWRELLG